MRSAGGTRVIGARGGSSRQRGENRAVRSGGLFCPLAALAKQLRPDLIGMRLFGRLASNQNSLRVYCVVPRRKRAVIISSFLRTLQPNGYAYWITSFSTAKLATLDNWMR